MTLMMFLFALTASAKEHCIKVDYHEEKTNAIEEIAQVFYHSTKGMYLFVKQPVMQYVRMDLDNYTYFYPENNMALVINNSDAVLASAPIQLFVHASSEDMGVQGMGFVLKEHFIQNDTLVKVWELKGQQKDEYLRLEAYHSRKYLLKTVSLDNENEVMKTVIFNDWLDYNNYSYPMSIKIIESDVKSHYTFSNIEILEDIPDSVERKLKLPEDCEIHEYKW